MTKSLGNFENKQPDCTLLFIFVFQLYFSDCILAKIVCLDQLLTAMQQKLLPANRKLVFFKMPSTFCRFTVQNCHHFLPCRSNDDVIESPMEYFSWNSRTRFSYWLFMSSKSRYLKIPFKYERKTLLIFIMWSYNPSFDDIMIMWSHL